MNGRKRKPGEEEAEPSNTKRTRNESRFLRSVELTFSYLKSVN